MRPAVGPVQGRRPTHSVRGPGHRSTLSTGFQGVNFPVFPCGAWDASPDDGVGVDCLVGALSSSVSAWRDTGSRPGPRAWNVRASAILAKPAPEAVTSARRRGNSETHVSAQRPQTSEAPRLSASHVHPGRAGHPQGAPPQGPPPLVGLTRHRNGGAVASPSRTRGVGRVRGRHAFGALRREGTRRRSGPITVTALRDPAAGGARVAYAVSRAVGGAVQRNRLRRQLRAIVREADLEPGAYLVSAAPVAAELPFDALAAHVEQACRP